MSSLNKDIETALKDKGYTSESINDLQSILREIHVVPYERLSEEISKRRELEKSSQEYAAGLEQLRADNSALKKDIQALKSELKASGLRHEVETKLIKVGAKDAHLLMKCLNFDKIQQGDDGYITGLDEQIEKLQSTAPYMFNAIGDSKRPPESQRPVGENVVNIPHGVEPVSIQSAPVTSKPAAMTLGEALKIIDRYGY